MLSHIKVGPLVGTGLCLQIKKKYIYHLKKKKKKLFHLVNLSNLNAMISVASCYIHLLTSNLDLPFIFSLAERGLSVLQRSLGYAALGVSTSLSVSVFFLQFLEWWYASNANVGSLTSLPTPPPPKVRANKDRVLMKWRPGFPT